MQYYKDQFADKVVYCNCDDPFKSNFFKYFVLHFNELHLKKLICTCYDGNYINTKVKQLFDYRLLVPDINRRNAWKIEVTKVNNSITADMTNDELMRHTDGNPELLKNNRDFRSNECIEILKRSDIVVTNPPFSLFREFILQIIKYGKQFHIIGSVNAVSYNEVFAHIMQGDIKVGHHDGSMSFYVVDHYATLSNIWWYSNLHCLYNHPDIAPHKSYNDKEYQKYDNYDAIEVSHINDIPCDYFGVMGVPVRIISRNYRDLFDIVGLANGGYDYECKPVKQYQFAIQHNKDNTISNGSKINTGANLLVSDKPSDTTYYTVQDINGYLIQCYARVFIRRKQ